jgi:hypothetical protein
MRESRFFVFVQDVCWGIWCMRTWDGEMDESCRFEMMPVSTYDDGSRVPRL